MEVLETAPEAIVEEETNKSYSPLSAINSKQSNCDVVLQAKTQNAVTESPTPETSNLALESPKPLTEAGLTSKEIEVLYSRTQKRIFVQNSERIPETDDDDPIIRLQKTGRTPLTQINEYRAFMVASTSLKTCLLEMVQNVKKCIAILERNTSILREPGFGGINILRCWIWIFEEALILTRPPENNKTEWKALVTKLMKDAVSAYDNISEITQRLEELYEKLKTELAKLVTKSKTKFYRNVNGAQEFWKNSDKVTKDIDVDNVEWIKPHVLKPNKRILKVRWTVDGITLRINETSQWVKFKSIQAFEDKKVLVKIFTEGLKDPWSKVNGTLLEMERFMLSTKQISIETLMRKLLGMLKLNTKYVFVPKEEIMMLNAVLTNLAIFESIQPLLDHLKKRVAKNLQLVSEISGRQNEIILGKGKRVPLGRWSELMLELVVHSSVEAIFVRHSKKSKGDETNQEGKKIENFDVEVIYQNTVFPNSSTQNTEFQEDNPTNEVDVVKAKLTVESIPDTCYIFVDVRPEYETALSHILRNRKFQECHLELCCDNVKTLYHAVNQMEVAITEGNCRLIEAREYLLQNNSDSHRNMPTTMWIKILCKSLSVWDTRQLSLQSKDTFQNNFRKLLSKTEMLEESINRLMQFMLQQKNSMARLHEYLMTIAGFDMMSRLRFKQEMRKDSLAVLSEEDSMDEIISLNFTDFDMFISISSKTDSKKINKFLSLNQSPERFKVEIICDPFNPLMRLINLAIRCISLTTKSLDENLHLKSIQESLIPSKEVFIPYFHKLEAAIITSIVKGLEFKLGKLVRNLQLLDATVGNLSGMVNLVHLQITEKKLVSVRSLEPLNNEHIEEFENFIQQIPNSIQIKGITAKNEYRQIVEYGAQEMDSIPTRNVNVQQNVHKVETPSLPIYTELTRTPELLNSGILKDAYLKTLVFWLKRFEKQMLENMTNSLSELVSPKASQAIVDESRYRGVGNLDKSFGFVDGLFFLVRECIASLRIPDPCSGQQEDPVPSLKYNLIQLASTIRRLDSVGSSIGPNLTKLDQSILSYKRKLPQDMSFLDDHMEELGTKPDIFQTILAIWKRSQENSQPIDESIVEMEIQWESTKKSSIYTRSSTQPEAWRDVGMMSSSSQVQVINVLYHSTFAALNQSCSHLLEADREIRKGRNLLKYVWNKIQADEKASVLPPSSVYVILKLFSHHIVLSTLMLEAIIHITMNAKAVLAFGMQHLNHLTSRRKVQSRQARKYPDSMLVKVIIPAPEDIKEWLREDTYLEENAHGDHNVSIIELKTAVEIKSSSSIISIKETGDETKENMSIMKKSSVARTSLASTLSKTSVQKEDLLGSLQNMDATICSVLRETQAIIKTPDTSLTENVKADHFIGILVVLISSTLGLQFYKEASDPQRAQVLTYCKGLINRFKTIVTSPTADDIHTSLTKIENRAETIEKFLTEKFNQRTYTSNPATEDLEMSPEDLAEHFAVKISGYVWNVICGPDGGVVLKNQKSHESHAYMRLPLTKRIEIVASIMKYVDQILVITESNLQVVKRDLNTSKGIIKTYTKKVPALAKKEIINETNILRTMDAISSLKTACDASHNYVDQIMSILENGNGIINNIYSYYTLKFRLETPNPELLRDYKSAMENKIMELEINFAELQRIPISVDVPLSLSPIDFSYN